MWLASKTNSQALKLPTFIKNLSQLNHNNLFAHLLLLDLSHICSIKVLLHPAGQALIAEAPKTRSGSLPGSKNIPAKQTTGHNAGP
jgi:hypothetical protein